MRFFLVLILFTAIVAKSPGQTTRRAFALSPAIVQAPRLRCAVQLGMEYPPSPRLSLLTELAFPARTWHRGIRVSAQPLFPVPARTPATNCARSPERNLYRRPVRHRLPEMETLQAEDYFEKQCGYDDER